MFVEYRDVGRHARRQQSTIRNAEQLGRLGGHPVDGALETHGFLFAHPVAEHIGGVVGFEQHVDMGTAIRHAEQDAVVVYLFTGTLLVNISYSPKVS